MLVVILSGVTQVGAVRRGTARCSSIRNTALLVVRGRRVGHCRVIYGTNSIVSAATEAGEEARDAQLFYTGRPASHRGRHLEIFLQTSLFQVGLKCSKTHSSVEVVFVNTSNPSNKNVKISFSIG